MLQMFYALQVSKHSIIIYVKILHTNWPEWVSYILNKFLQKP